MIIPHRMTFVCPAVYKQAALLFEEDEMKEGLIGAATALAAVVTYGAVTGAQAPAPSARPAVVYPPPEAKIQPGDAPAYAFDITKAEIDYVLKNSPASPPDRQLRVVDMGKYNLGVGIIRRGPTNDKPGDPVPVLWHDYTPEIYYITSGSGVLTTGGVILNQRAGQGVPNVMNGPSGSGIAGPGSYSRRVGPGDIIIIPNKVAHGWSGVTDHVEYLSYRPDPDRVLPAGWVYPSLLRITPPEVPTPGVGRGGAPAAAPAQGGTAAPR
jgi:mannose-6-phosphate isomerase-like protein (cupin superfamily)